MNDNRHECSEGWEEADLLAYVEGELEPGQTENLERHLPQCDRCAESIRKLSQMIGLLRETPAAFHPSTEDLAGFVATGRDENFAISTHLAECTACAEDAEILREMRTISSEDIRGETLPVGLADELLRRHGVSTEDSGNRSFLCRIASLFGALRSAPIFALGTAAAAVVILALAVPIWRSYKEEIAPMRFFERSIDRRNGTAGGFPEGIEKYSRRQAPALKTPQTKGALTKDLDQLEEKSKNDLAQKPPEQSKAEQDAGKKVYGSGFSSSTSQEDRERQTEPSAESNGAEKKPSAQTKLGDQPGPHIPEVDSAGPVPEAPGIAMPSKPVAKQAPQETRKPLRAADSLAKTKKRREGGAPLGAAPQSVPKYEGSANTESSAKERRAEVEGAPAGPNRLPAESRVVPAPTSPSPEARVAVWLIIVNGGVKGFDPGSYKPPRVADYDLRIESTGPGVGPTGQSLNGSVAEGGSEPRIVITLHPSGAGSDVLGELYQPAKRVPRRLSVSNVRPDNIPDEMDKIIRRLLANESGDQ